MYFPACLLRLDITAGVISGEKTLPDPPGNMHGQLSLYTNENSEEKHP